LGRAVVQIGFSPATTWAAMGLYPTGNCFRFSLY